MSQPTLASPRSSISPLRQRMLDDMSLRGLPGRLAVPRVVRPRDGPRQHASQVPRAPGADAHRPRRGRQLRAGRQAGAVVHLVVSSRSTSRRAALSRERLRVWLDVVGSRMKPISYARHQFPPEVIRHAV